MVEKPTLTRNKEGLIIQYNNLEYELKSQNFLHQEYWKRWDCDIYVGDSDKLPRVLHMRLDRLYELQTGEHIDRLPRKLPKGKYETDIVRRKKKK